MIRGGWQHSGALVGLLALSAPAASFGATIEQVSGYAAVQRAFLREEFQQAVGLAQSFILNNPAEPDVPRVWLWLVLSLDKLQQPSEALRELNRLKNRLAPGDPLWPEALYWEGDISRRALQVIRARMAFQRVLERYPDSSWALQARLGIGLVDLHQQAFEAAIASFRHVALQQPDSPAAKDARRFEGICQLQLKRFPEAEAIFHPLLEQMKDPVNVAQTAFYLGEALSGQGKFADAMPIYERAAEITEAPQWSRPAQFGLGWAYYRLGRCEESVKVFERFLRGTTTDYQTEAWFAQGSCLTKLGRDDEALSSFERILSRSPNHPLAVESGVIIADAYRRQGRSAMADELLHRLLERRPEPGIRAQVQLRLASIALENGNAAQARTLYQMAREAPDAATQQAAVSGLGDVQLFLGDVSGARQAYEEVARRMAGSALAHYAAYQLGRIAMQARQFEDAAAIFERLAVSAEDEIADDARFAGALTALSQSDEAGALAILESVRRKQPGRVAAARAAYYLALIALNSGDDAEAKALCQDTIAKAPLTEEAIDARLLTADLIARQDSVADAVRWLQRAYVAAKLPRRHRAKLAKRLGDLARGQRAYAEAMLWYDEAAELLPSLRGESIYQIAACYEEAGDAELAMAWYRQVQQEPWRIRGQMALAKLLERGARFAEAERIYQQLARESIPEAAVAAERLAAVRELKQEKKRQ
ncbi:MAG: tetratricopeptide repeat protein [Candidatus Omnitrophica bacterium]|nr:tetratricopeptide repeat protein [Candidatus Omnitrophota bacterium]